MESDIITAPGTYATAGYKQTGDDDWLVRIWAKSRTGRWIGETTTGVGVGEWWDRGNCHNFTNPLYRIIGRYVPPVLTITEFTRRNGWVFAWCDYSGPVERGKSRGRMHVMIWERNSVGHCPCDGHFAISPNAPFVCEEKDWPRLQEMVAEVNAEAPK